MFLSLKLKLQESFKMIQQPELGRKIADHRKAKGFTQEELVEKCRLSVRTLQRIEAGQVSPRAYTVRLIFDALELTHDKSLNSLHKKNKGLIKKWLEQFYIRFIDLFNLKTNMMRKITILSLALFAIFFSITLLSNETFAFAHSDSKVEKIIENNNANFFKWFNSGEINQLVELYHEDACLISRGCGKEFIKNYYNIESSKYKFIEIKVTSVSVSDSIAVEKGKWSVKLNSGETIGGEYLSEWRYINKKWLIMSESSGLSFE